MISMPAPVPFMVDTSMLCSDTNGSPYLFDICTDTNKQTNKQIIVTTSFRD